MLIFAPEQPSCENLKLFTPWYVYIHLYLCQRNALGQLKAFHSLRCLFAIMACGQRCGCIAYWSGVLAARPDHGQIVKRLPPRSRYDAGLLIGTRLLNLHQFTPSPLRKHLCGMAMIKRQNIPKHETWNPCDGLTTSFNSYPWRHYRQFANIMLRETTFEKLKI